VSHPYKQLKPGLVASYDLWPANKMNLFWKKYISKEISKEVNKEERKLSKQTIYIALKSTNRGAFRPQSLYGA